MRDLLHVDPHDAADGCYALGGVARYGLNYGRCGCGARRPSWSARDCGLLVDKFAASSLIWVIVAVATLGAFRASGATLDRPKPAATVSAVPAPCADPDSSPSSLPAALIQGVMPPITPLPPSPGRHSA